MRWRTTHRCKVMEAEMLWLLWLAAGLGYVLVVHKKEPRSTWVAHPYPGVTQADWACCRRSAVL